jgi:hypothetical protein
MAVVAFFFEAFIGFGLYFAPGWANGWPFGLTIHVVWSSGMTVLLFLLTVTLAVAIGAAVGLCCSWFKAGRRESRRAFALWLVGATATAFAISYLAYGVIFASTWEMWPNGYNP